MVNLPPIAPIFTPEWRDRYAPQTERGMVAAIRLFEVGEREYDAETDTWTEVETVIYEGKARVQPLRSSSRRTVPGNTTEVITFLVSVPYGATELDISLGQHMRVTDGGLNTALTTYKYVVSEITDSSNPIEKTFMVQTNQESRV